MSDALEKFTEYRRSPIQISEYDCILIRLFHATGKFEDLWAMDIGHPHEHDTIYDNAAEQFVQQLEGNDCIAFHQALIRACQKRVAEWEERCAVIAAQQKG